MTASPEAAAYRPLPKIYKTRYPFRLSVPSFVYPDTWAANARMLGPNVDEIELLFFESKPEGSLPSREEIDALSRISEDFSLGYNIHLPTDVSLAAPGREGRIEALDALRRVVGLTLPLDPLGWTLHIPLDPSMGTGADDIQRWRGRAREGLEKLLGAGVPSRRLAVENLDYPFGWVRNIIRELDVSVCMDAGHLLLRGEDVSAFYREYFDRIAVIHLHGVRGGRDHLPLSALSMEDGASVVNILEDYTATLSVEVFSYDHLTASLLWLEKMAFNLRKSA